MLCLTFCHHARQALKAKYFALPACAVGVKGKNFCPYVFASFFNLQTQTLK
jgi:hypothetical protein